MDWIVKFKKSSVKQLKKLDTSAQKRIINFLRVKVIESGNPRSMGKSLRGKLGELWRYRVGDYRVICQIQDHSITVLVLNVAHRKEIYRKV